jgi:hypothetical protein
VEDQEAMMAVVQEEEKLDKKPDSKKMGLPIGFGMC